MDSKNTQRKIRYMPRKKRKDRADRPKSFASEAAAKTYAEENKIKNYDIIKPNFGLSKKFKIVEK